ncbi:MAG TPA: Rne/Rng family ribonuclease [Stellaceae bacterium]|nr:Rne/Rng family ribonuclease [Stellaceae bacterium]
MAKRMLIDATHSEETRVVVLDGNRLEEFDFESSTKKQIKGNIYLAKITRVEPSLQAAFVEYGGNRHGFLAFSEIHPDYYRIPVSDREAMLAEENAAARAEEAADAGQDGFFEESEPAFLERSDTSFDAEEQPETPEGYSETPDGHGETQAAAHDHGVLLHAEDAPFAERVETSEATEAPEADESPDAATVQNPTEARAEPASPRGGVEIVGGDEVEEVEEVARQRVRHYRNYKIQEVIKRRQIILVQVTKEERGTKGAALTTYLSLAGRYCVLMPNAGRGGGVSRKITSAQDRRRLKELMEELSVPEGMGVIVRTAGSERSKAEIKRDYEYLMRLWDDIRDLTLKSSAPALIYEEGNLIKRAIRDLYARDIDEVVVDGEDGYRSAKDFMKMLMPSHARRVQPYRDPTVPLFHRFQVDSQIDTIHNPVVQLRSGGYIVINPTEALVAIDVNSGRSTKERNIEETATKTNLEAAEEVARQLRLRDLAGLIVIDFIDMEEGRNQAAVERKLKDAMKNDRARIQLGRISPFGLLELSRQRLRSSLIEASTQPCPHCAGTGTIRSTESAALVVLRAIEEEGIRRRTAEVAIYVPTAIALYVLNQKREALGAIEKRYGFHVAILQDDALIQPAFRLERLRALTQAEIDALPVPVMPPPIVEDDDFDEDEAADEDMTAEHADGEEAGEAGDGGEPGRRKRRRRKRRRNGDARTGDEASADHQSGDAQFGDAPSQGGEETTGDQDADSDDDASDGDDDDAIASESTEAGGDTGTEAGGTDEANERRRRRRGRRGGRRRSRRDDPSAPSTGDAEQSDMTDAASTGHSGFGPAESFANDGRLPTDHLPTDPLEAEYVEPALPPAVQDGPAEEVVETVAATPAPRRRSRRKVAAADGDAVVVPEAVPPEAAIIDLGTEALPIAEPKKPRSRRKAAVAEEMPRQLSTEVPAPAPEAVSAAPIVEAAPEATTVEVLESAAPTDEAEESATPRKGWWKRLIQP